MKISKKYLFVLLLLTFQFVTNSQSNYFNCGVDDSSHSSPGSSTNCSATGFNSFRSTLFFDDFLEDFANCDINIPVNILIFQRDDGTGNFDLSIQEHQNFIDSMLNASNWRVGNYTDPNCNTITFPFISNPNIQFDFNVFEIPNEFLWNYRNTGFRTIAGGPIFTTAEYVDSLEAELIEHNIDHGINVVFAVDGPETTELENCGGACNCDSITWNTTFHLGEFPYNNLNSISWAFMSNVYPEWLLRTSNPQCYLDSLGNPINVNTNVGWHRYEMAVALVHEIGHTLDLIHTQACGNSNIMSRQVHPRSHFTPSQIAEMLGSLSMTSANTDLFCTENFGCDIVIDGPNARIDGVTELHQNIIVTSGNTLTVTCELFMPDDGQIYLEQGSRLIVDEGIITSCGEWKGIRAEGRQNFNDTPAEIQIINGGIIENAEIAISDELPGFSGGVVVTCDNCEIINNGIGVLLSKSKPLSASSFTDGNISDNSIGVSLINNDGVTFSSCSFNNGVVNVALSDATVTIDSSCQLEDSFISVKASHTFPKRRGTRVLNSDFTNNNIDIFSSGSALGLFEINENVFSGNLESIYMDGDNFFEISNNDFLGSELGSLLLSNGTSPNEFSANSVSGSLIGTYPVFSNDNLVIHDNCYSNISFADIWIEGTINDNQGDNSEGAGNCFSGATIDLGTVNADSFTYWRPLNLLQCLDPVSTGNHTLRDATGISGDDCGAGSPPSTRIFCFLGPFSNSQEINNEILNVQSAILNIGTYNYPIEVENAILSYYNWCLLRLRLLLADRMVEEGDLEGGVNVLTGMNLFSYKIKGYGLYMSDQEYLKADSLLNTFYTVDPEEQDFIDIQRINIQRLLGNELELTNSDSLLIRNAGMSANPIAAYARSLWYILTGEIIYVDVPDVSTYGNFESREYDLTELEVLITPNPANHQINIYIGQVLENLNFEIINTSGAKVSSGTLSNRYNYLNIDNLISGTYFIRIFEDRILKRVEKLVIIK